jgi:hypothetical protein
MLKTHGGISYLSQRAFWKAFGYESDAVVKYNYDRYTWFLKVPPIRKRKTRKKVAKEAGYRKLNISKILEVHHGLGGSRIIEH